MKHEAMRHPKAEHHGSMQEHSSHEHSRHAMYRNEVDKPMVPPHGHQEMGMGVHDFKGEAQDIAYGQASEQGCKADEKRMSSI